MATTLLPKQRLKDYCRKKQLPSPIYVLIDEEKIDLHKHYTIQVCINNVVTAEGRGLSRRIAEFKAAMSAMYFIGQCDPTVFDNNRPQKFGRLSLGRSFSVDHISRAQRTDSVPSMMSLAVGPGQFSSAAPSIDGIDSLTENNDSLYGSEIANSKDDYANRNTTVANNKVDEEEASSESTDEGVELEISESSATPTASSPTSLAASQTKTIVENQNGQKASNQLQSSSVQKLPTHSNGETVSKSKGKKSLSSSFLSSFFMLSSLRAISRRSLRRKTPPKQSSFKSTEKSLENTAASPATTQSRPTSATSSASTSSAFSSVSSISSSQQTTSNSSTSGSFTLPDDADVPVVLNGFSSLMMADTIIEEEEEEEEDGEKATVDSSQRKTSTESNQSETLCDGSHLERLSHDMSLSGSITLPRSSSSSYVLSSMCPHNHFSIYGPVLCSNQQAAKNLTIEATPSAALLRYCVRLFCPLPYYDIRGSNSKFDQKFYVTCRVVLCTSKTDKDKLPVTLPEQYKNYEFTARGNGETLRSARNMAAQTIIDKLKKANIYFE